MLKGSLSSCLVIVPREVRKMLAENKYIALGAALGVYLILMDLLYLGVMKRALCAVEKTEEIHGHIHRWSWLAFVNIPFWCIVFLSALFWRERVLLPLAAVVTTVIFSAVLANRELKSRRMLLREGKRIYRTVEWTPVIHGETHIISYRFERDKEEHKLFVDGHEHPLKNKAAKAFFRVDECVIVDGQPLYLVRAGSKVDVAVDGVFLERQKPYLPQPRFAWWSWLFVVICLLPLVLLGGGALTGSLAALGVLLCMKESKAPFHTTPARILVCLSVIAVEYLILLGVNL